MIIDLSFKELPIGTQVKTKKGFVFTKLGDDHWRDETAQLDWLPGEKTGINHYDAERLGTLPTRDQFIESEKHGIREILDMNGKFYWSSTLNRYSADGAHIFDGHFGISIGYHYRDGHADEIAARFVSEVKK